MKERNRAGSNWPSGVILAALFLALIILTLLLFNYYNSSKKHNSDFDISMISDIDEDVIEVKQLFVPQFVGISCDGSREGLSFPLDAVNEIFARIAPSVSNLFETGAETVSSEKQWREAVNTTDSIYVRLHSQFPVSVVHMFINEITGNDYRYLDNGSSVHEMLVIPYSDTDSSMTLYIRSITGEVRKFQSDTLSDYLTVKDLNDITAAYSTVLEGFMFSKDMYSSVIYSEPVFSSGIYTKNIIITNGIASMILDFKNGTESLLRTFDMNIDKVNINTSDDEDTISYLDSNGIVYVGKSSYEFKAVNNEGIKLNKFIGYKKDKEPSPRDYISAAMIIVNSIREIESSFFIGRGELYLSDISMNGNRAEITFSYSFDNIPIINTPPAIHVVFESQRLVECSIYTLTIKDRATRSDPLYEWGFLKSIGNNNSGMEVVICYNADYTSESVSSEFIAFSAKH